MYRNFFKILSIFVVFHPLNSFSWGWKEASLQTLQKNQLLQSRQQEVDAASFQTSVAKSALFPSVTLRGGWNEFLGQRKTLEHQAFIGPRFQWVLYQGGKIGKGIDVATYQEKQAELHRTLARVELNSKLRQAYANALYAKEALQLAEKIEQRRLENVRFTQIRYQSGLEFKWVYSTSKVKWEMAKTDSQGANLEQVSAFKDMEALMGPLPIKTITEVSSDGFYNDEQLNPPDQVVSSFEKHPQIQFLQAKVEEARARVDFTNADRYPLVAFQGDTLLSSVTKVDRFPYLSAGIVLSMPLFAGFGYVRKTDAARALYQQQVSEFEQAKLDLVARIQRTYQEYVLAKRRLEISRMNLEAAEDRARVVSKQYQSGLTNFLDWERSQDDWVTAEKDLLSIIRASQVARAKFEEAIGVELVSS